MENSPEVSDPRGESEPERGPLAHAPLARNPWGWILLAAFFLLVASSTVAGSFRRDGPDAPEVKGAARTIEMSISLAQLAKGKGPAAGSLRPALEGTRKDLGDAPGESALMRLLIDRELGKEPAARDVRLARNLPKELAPALPYAAVERPKEAAPIDPDEPFLVRLAKAQAKERAGVARDVARRDLVLPGFGARYGFYFAGLLSACAIAVALWLWYGITRASGGFRPLGLPSLPMTPAEADRFALRGAMIFGGFLFGGGILSFLPVSMTIKMALQIFVYGGVALYCLRLPADPNVPHLSRAGLEMNLDRFGQRALWGVAAAIANIPVVLIITAISHVVFKNVPAPTHPASESLLHHPSLFVVLLTFLFASICAPIWEETFFRGLLFQGLAAARFGSIRLAPIGGALLSSFLFASIHPQGIAGWPPLAAIALMSCALLAQTRSLISSICMHVTHNTLLLVMTLVVGPLLGQVTGFGPGFEVGFR